jgi:hypothetical protein
VVELSKGSSKRWKPFFDPDPVGKGVLNSLLRKRRFSDVVLASWAIVEMNINSTFQLTLGIESPNDKRIRIVELRVLQFEDKLQFLRHVGTVTEHEYEAIARFQHDRNGLVHVKRGEMPWFFNISRDEKEAVMGHAWHAAQASNRAIERAISELTNRHVQQGNRENDGQ